VALIFASSRALPIYKMERGVGPKSSILMPQLKNNVNCVRDDLRIICILRVI
jgi:hypothetical protein